MGKSMEDYISETTEVLIANVENRKELTASLAAWLREEGIESGKSMVWVASGSSYNAIACAMPFMKEYMDNEVRLVSPFEYCYYEKITKDSIYMFVSQSGYSTNIIEAIEKCQKEGGYAIALLGRMDSPIAKMANQAIAWGVGEEMVGYVTKGVMALTLYCMLMIVEMMESKWSEEKTADVLSDIKKAAANHHKMYEYAKDFCEKNTKAMCSMDHVMLMSAGSNMGTIREGALKMSEMIHIQTSYFEVEEYVHGPNLQCDPKYTLFFVDGGDAAGKRVCEIAEASKELTDKVFLIRTTDGNLEPTSELVSPLYMTAIFQYIACWAARVLRIDDDHFLYYNFKKHVHNKTDGIVYANPF